MLHLSCLSLSYQAAVLTTNDQHWQPDVLNSALREPPPGGERACVRIQPKRPITVRNLLRTFERERGECRWSEVVARWREPEPSDQGLTGRKFWPRSVLLAPFPPPHQPGPEWQSCW